MNNDKILSIIIPSYNMEAYLSKCLGSLVIADKRLFQKLDVIVVNDGSKDNTSKIAHEFEVKYPSVFRVIDKSNGHYGSCVNAALPIVEGEYVKVLDADDSFDTANLEEFIRFIESRVVEGRVAEVDVIFSDRGIVDGSGQISKPSRYPLPTNREFTLSEIIDAFPNGFSMHGITYKTELLRRINYKQLEGVCYTDTLWCFLPMANVRKGLYFNKLIYLYLIGRDGQSADMREVLKNFAMYIAVFDEMIYTYQTRKKELTDSGIKYLEYEIFLFLKLLYRISVFHMSARAAVKQFSELDDYLRKFPDQIVGWSEQVTITRRFKLRYVSHLRRLRSMRLVYIMAIQILWRIIGILAMIRQKINYNG